MTYHARVTDSGEVLLPVGLAKALGLQPGDTPAIEIDGDHLRVDREGGAQAALRRVRAVMRGYSVDQFIAERAADQV